MWRLSWEAWTSLQTFLCNFQRISITYTTKVDFTWKSTLSCEAVTNSQKNIIIPHLYLIDHWIYSGPKKIPVSGPRGPLDLAILIFRKALWLPTAMIIIITLGAFPTRTHRSVSKLWWWLFSGRISLYLNRFRMPTRSSTTRHKELSLGPKLTYHIFSED